MRIWDIPPEQLCDKHLLGEHRELHAIWNILTQNKKGYRKHPEVKRWINDLGTLKAIHNMIVVEMKKRGFGHSSPLIATQNINCNISRIPYFESTNSLKVKQWQTTEQQIKILKEKGCDCNV